jgi:hypothetical protein
MLDAIKSLPDWTCHGFVPDQVLSYYATFRSKVTGLLYPKAEWRLRGL